MVFIKYARYHHRLINAIKAKRGINYTCPFCHRWVIVHAAKTRRAFFVHRSQSGNYYNPAETNEHLLGKRQLFNFFRPIFKTIEVEKYLQQINQWPDLMFNRVAIEFQCSPISARRLTERINGYSKLGIKSWWILGSPYYKRYLRSTYLSRFMNYSKYLGFFILFWRVCLNGLEIHYQMREKNGHLVYKIRRFFNCQKMLEFVTSDQLNRRWINSHEFNRSVHSEVTLNQKRLFHGDKQLITLQSEVNPVHNSLMGCPLVCHLPSYTFPIFKQRALLWRIWILLSLPHYLSLKAVYKAVNAKLQLPLKFCQIKDSSRFYRFAFIEYINILRRIGYLKLNVDGKKITRFKEPRWFNSCYDKFKFLKNNYRFK